MLSLLECAGFLWPLLKSGMGTLDLLMSADTVPLPRPCSRSLALAALSKPGKARISHVVRLLLRTIQNMQRFLQCGMLSNAGR